MAGVFHKTIAPPHRGPSGAGATDGWWSFEFQIRWSGERCHTSAVPTRRHTIFVPAANVPSVGRREDRSGCTSSRGQREDCFRSGMRGARLRQVHRIKRFIHYSGVAALSKGIHQCGRDIARAGNQVDYHVCSNSFLITSR